MQFSAETKKIAVLAKKYPWLIAFISSASLALWQWSTTNAQEKRKYESGLVAKALEEKDSGAVADKLRLLLSLELVRKDHYPDIEMWASDPDKIPGFAGAAIRDKLVTFGDVKRALNKLGKYEGDMLDKNSPALRRAIARFQFEKKIDPDGLVGPKDPSCPDGSFA